MWGAWPGGGPNQRELEVGSDLAVACRPSDVHAAVDLRNVRGQDDVSPDSDVLGTRLQLRYELGLTRHQRRSCSVDELFVITKL